MTLEKCDVITIAISFASALSMSIRWTRVAVSGSSVPVGSSAKSRNGFFASCRASTTRCFSPPERSRAMCIIRWESRT